MNLPKNADTNPNCLVDKLKKKCKQIFPDWSFGASYNTKTKKSSLYILKYENKSLNLTIQQVKDLFKQGYAIYKIDIQLIDFEFLGHNSTDMDYDEDDCMCESDPQQQFKPIIYVAEY